MRFFAVGIERSSSCRLDFRSDVESDFDSYRRKCLSRPSVTISTVSAVLILFAVADCTFYASLISVSACSLPLSGAICYNNCSGNCVGKIGDNPH